MIDGDEARGGAAVFDRPELGQSPTRYHRRKNKTFKISKNKKGGWLFMPRMMRPDTMTRRRTHSERERQAETPNNQIIAPHITLRAVRAQEGTSKQSRFVDAAFFVHLAHTATAAAAAVVLILLVGVATAVQ